MLPGGCEGEQDWRPALVLLVIPIASPLLVRLCFQQWHSGQSAEQQVDEGGGDECDELSSRQGGNGENGSSQPENDLPHVIGMTGVTPNARGDEFVLIGGVIAEDGLLPVRNHFNRHPARPYQHPNALHRPQMSSFRDVLCGVDCEEGTHGDDDPESLDEPGVEEPQFGLLDLHEATVLLQLADAHEEEEAQSSRPDEHHQGGNDLLQLHGGVGEGGDEGDGDEGETPRQVVVFLSVVEHCRNEGNRLQQQGERCQQPRQRYSQKGSRPPSESICEERSQGKHDDGGDKLPHNKSGPKIHRKKCPKEQRDHLDSCLQLSVLMVVVLRQHFHGSQFLNFSTMISEHSLCALVDFFMWQQQSSTLQTFLNLYPKQHTTKTVQRYVIILTKSVHRSSGQNSIHPTMKLSMEHSHRNCTQSVTRKLTLGGCEDLLTRMRVSTQQTTGRMSTKAGMIKGVRGAQKETVRICTMQQLYLPTRSNSGLSYSLLNSIWKLFLEQISNWNFLKRYLALRKLTAMRMMPGMTIRLSTLDFRSFISKRKLAGVTKVIRQQMRAEFMNWVMTFLVMRETNVPVLLSLFYESASIWMMQESRKLMREVIPDRTSILILCWYRLGKWSHLSIMGMILQSQRQLKVTRVTSRTITRIVLVQTRVFSCSCFRCTKFPHSTTLGFSAALIISGTPFTVRLLGWVRDYWIRKSRQC